MAHLLTGWLPSSTMCSQNIVVRSVVGEETPSGGLQQDSQLLVEWQDWWLPLQAAGGRREGLGLSERVGKVRSS